MFKGLRKVYVKGALDQRLFEIDPGKQSTFNTKQISLWPDFKWGILSPKCPALPLQIEKKVYVERIISVKKRAPSRTFTQLISKLEYSFPYFSQAELYIFDIYIPVFFLGLPHNSNSWYSHPEPTEQIGV